MIKILVPIKTKTKEKNLFAFDIETYGIENKFLMGSIYGEFKKYRKDRTKEYITKVNKVFWDKFNFIDYIINNSIFYEKSYIVATNLTFDLLALFGDTDILPNIDLTIRGSNIIYAKIKHRNHKKSIKFIDTLNFSKISVKQMGKLINLPKLPQPISFKRKPNDTTEKIELENYNKRDTRITYEYIKLLQNGFNNIGCNLKITIASTSMDLFKRKYLNNILCQNEKTIETLYKAYYGARVEVLKRGYIENLKYYDYNSLYPSVMLNNYPHPNYEKYLKKGNLFLLENKNYEGVMKVKIKIKDIDLPYLPYRNYINSNNYKLIFPIGIFSGYYSFYELRKALKLGYEILEFGECIYYSKTFKPFEMYIKDLYKIRLKYKEKKSILQEVSKLNMNTLYGKFAQKITDKEEIFHLSTLDYNKLNEFITQTEKYKSIIKGNYIYVKRKVISYIPSFVIPIFSIYTTAYGRTKLYNKIKKIGIENVYYYDTDSIITNKILNTSNKLGELKLEYFIKEGIITAPKMYSFKTDTNEVVKIKGIPHLNTFNEFNKLIKYKKFTYEKFVKFKEANNRNLQYNQILLIEKNLKMEDTKRLWDRPFNSNELQNSKPIVILENIN